MGISEDGKMWALVKDRPEEGLWLKRVPVPQPGRDEVRIRILKTAICGTDVHIWQWNEWARNTVPLGLTVGHEYLGVIESAGQGVHGLEPGTPVTGEGHITCGRCRNCLEGHRENCRDARGVGVDRNGAFAEYLVIPSSNVWPCDPGIPAGLYAIFDPFGNAAHAALTFDTLGEDVLICGAGPIGCMAAAITRFSGARNVIVTDHNLYRLDLAEKLGATRTVDLNRETLFEVMAKVGMTEGFDVGLEMSGSNSALRDMIRSMKHGGKIALLGLQDRASTVDLETVIFNGLTIKGIYGRKVWDTWYKMTAMIASGLDISGVITHRFRAEDYEDAFHTMLSGSSGKVILDWSDAGSIAERIKKGTDHE